MDIEAHPAASELVARSVYGRFFQLGYVARDIDLAIAQMERRMGAVVIDIVRDMRAPDGERVAIENLSHMAVPGVEIEIIQPRLDWPSIYLDALADDPRDMGFHHLGYLSPDRAHWDRVMAGLSAIETPVVMEGGTPRVRFAYIDTRRQTGHYSEIVLRFDPANDRPLP